MSDYTQRAVHLMSLLTREQHIAFDEQTDIMESDRLARTKKMFPARTIAKQVKNRIDAMERCYDTTKVAEPWAY